MAAGAIRSPWNFKVTRPLSPKLRSKDPACGGAAAAVDTAIRLATTTGARRRGKRMGVSHPTTREYSSCAQPSVKSVSLPDIFVVEALVEPRPHPPAARAASVLASAERDDRPPAEGRSDTRTPAR